MKYTTLGNTGIKVSVMALGCWPFQGGAYWGEQDDNVSIATVHAALDAGVNFFDTAEGYGDGKSEEVLGQALVGRRARAVTATKVSAEHLAAGDVAAACEGSLKRLQTDYIDLYQIHWPNHDVPIQETYGALVKLREQGKIRGIAVCNFALGDMAGILEVGAISSNQLPYSLLWRWVERGVQQECKKQGIGMLCYSPLMQGVLTGRYASADEMHPGLTRPRLYASTRSMARHGEPGCEAEVFAAVDKIRAIARELGQPMGHLALAWVRQQAAVLCLLVGARSPQELHDDIPAFDLTLSPAVMRRLEAATQPIKTYLGDNGDMWMKPTRMR